MAAPFTTGTYRHTDVLLLRATTHTADLPDAGDTPPADVDGGAALHRWLTRSWEQAQVRRAVELASPVLARRIDHLVHTMHPDARQVRRVSRSLVTYLLRWQGRATPFGLFAGVAAAHVGTTEVRFGADHRAVARADCGWLGTVIDRLEADPNLLHRVPITANTAAVLRDGHLIVPGRPEAGGGLRLVEVAVRLTAPLRAALDGAAEPITLADLGERMRGRFPAAEPAQITELLIGMVAHRLLLTRLRAPMTVPDALSHLRTVLDEVHAEDTGEIAELVRRLRCIHDELDLHDRTTCPAVASGIRSSAADAMRTVSDVTAQPLHVDVALDATVTVPAAVVVEATAAAEVLLRLSPHPFGYPRWKDYHLRFRRHYGAHAVVPIFDLVSDAGLGLPSGYLGSPQGRAPRVSNTRDDTLLALVQRAVVDGVQEIFLTDALIDALTVGDPCDVLRPGRTEIAFQIHAPTVEAVQAGRFRLLVTGTPRAGSSMAGRFADLLPDADRERLTDSYTAVGTADAVAVQLSFHARRRHSDNVVRTPRLLESTIAVAEHRDPGDDVVALDDIAVTADARSFFLVRMSTGRCIEPRVLHALEGGTLTPPLARFLAEITTARCAVYRGFDWGAAARLPYLPRVRYRRTVLIAARWLLTAADLSGHCTAPPDREDALTAWRRRWNVPPAVVLCEADLRLPVNLDRPEHRALLHARLDRTGELELREAPGPDELGWIGRAHELLLPLRSVHPRPAARRPGPVRPVTRDAGELPGRSRWLFAQLFGHPARHDDILTGHLPALITRLGDREPMVWWFRRHRDMTDPQAEQRLDLYLRLSGADAYGVTAGVVADWTAAVREHGLVSHLQLGTYQPQTGRYGHAQVMTAAEDVFAADSAAAVAQLAVTRTGTAVEAVTAAGLYDLARSFAATPADGARRLLDAVPHQRGPVDTAARDEALRLADPATGWAALRARPGGDAVIAAWHHRRAALDAYRRHLIGHRDPLPVLRSLLHEHHVRTAGVDPDRERVTHRLARAAALRQTVRTTGGAR